MRFFVPRLSSWLCIRMEVKSSVGKRNMLEKNDEKETKTECKYKVGKWSLTYTNVVFA